MSVTERESVCVYMHVHETGAMYVCVCVCVTGRKRVCGCVCARERASFMCGDEFAPACMCICASACRSEGGLLCTVLCVFLYGLMSFSKHI